MAGRLGIVNRLLQTLFDAGAIGEHAAEDAFQETSLVPARRARWSARPIRSRVGCSASPAGGERVQS